MVADRLRKTAMKAAARHDSNATDPTLEIEERVLLKRNAFTGPHKLADRYFETSHLVVNKNEEGDLYEVRPIMGGASRWVNRRQLVPDPRGREEEVLRDVLPDVGDEDEPGPPEDRTDQEALSDDDDDDDDGEDDYHNSFKWIYSTSHDVGLESEGRPRRSERVSKGINPYPGRLPVSAITGLPEESFSV